MTTTSERERWRYPFDGIRGMLDWLPLPLMNSPGREKHNDWENSRPAAGSRLFINNIGYPARVFTYLLSFSAERVGSAV